MRTAIDTNVLSAILSNEPRAVACIETLQGARREGALAISPVVWVELRAHPLATDRLLQDFLIDTGISVDFELREEVWAQAARRFAQYARRRRANSGSPKRQLADFVVGAHALLHADRLFSGDTERYRRDFPELLLL